MRKFTRKPANYKTPLILILLLLITLSSLISAALLRFKLSYVGRLLEVVEYGGATTRELSDALKLILLTAVTTSILFLVVLTFVGYFFDIDELKWKTKKKSKE